jgi:catechol 2,3-dioxygenase-like lactoylglutathione lyase family enzyme
MRLQLAINVSDLDAAIDFYRKILGVETNKREPGYANFVIDDPALKLVLFEAPGADNKLNHLGFEVFDDAEVDVAQQRLAAADVAHEEQSGEVCCFARQNKVLTFDPDGTMWEWYRVLEDVPAAVAEQLPCCDVQAKVTEQAASSGCC